MHEKIGEKNKLTAGIEGRLSTIVLVSRAEGPELKSDYFWWHCIF